MKPEISKQVYIWRFVWCTINFYSTIDSSDEEEEEEKKKKREEQLFAVDSRELE